MAKVSFGCVVSDARGKFGVTVFSKNRHSAYIRTKVTPANPKTPFQITHRNIFSAVSKRWTAVLTPAQRAAWRAAATKEIRRTQLGGSYAPTGFTLFCQLNVNAQDASDSFKNTPPLTFESASPTSLNATLHLGTSTFTVATTFLPLGTDGYFLYGTAPQPAGRNFVGHVRRLLVTSLTPPPATQNIYAAYVARFSVPIAGNHIGLWFKMLNASTGWLSQPLFVLVTAVP